MATLVLTKDGIYVGDVCVAKYYPIAGLRSRFVSAVQQIPVAWKHLAKVGCLIVLAGSTYLGYKIYWHFCNRTSLNRHLQGSEWIELSKDSIIEVIEEPRLENNLPHNDALREEHPRIMKIARILVRTSMAGSQLNEDTPQINLQTENSSLVLPDPMAVDPSDISDNNDTVQPTTSTAISTLEVPVTVDPSDITVCNVTLQPTTSASISILEPRVPVTEPSDISVCNEATSASILKKIGEHVGFLNIFETHADGSSTEVERQEFCKAVDSLQIISRFLSQTHCDDEFNTNYTVNNVKLIAIRRDVFSLLRAVLLQNVMCLNSLLQRIGGAQCLFQKFKTWSESNQNWLMHWQFHAINRFGMSSFHEILYSCLDALQSLEEKANMERHSFIILACAKRQLSFVAKLLEIMKLIMMASAIELFEQQDDLAIVPSFASVLFSRDQTCTPKYLMLNHFNPLGHTEERLEEIDFSLLGYSLRETVTIVRPYLYGTQDYVKHYPECMIGIWPEVVVFANKEGQYSIRGN